ncbi:hypothetical protein Syun_011464 [Stephania yunnanensis]|uniref:Uncharacterized protein n=1 Tax=Stephania yunnanensis TaxID=152371 RepID=A0AAP0JYA7_9MAGN
MNFWSHDSQILATSFGCYYAFSSSYNFLEFHDSAYLGIISIYSAQLGVHDNPKLVGVGYMDQTLSLCLI